MSVLEIRGGSPLGGQVKIPGAKNAILPLMASAVLTNKPVHFKNVPRISDVESMINLLRSYGVEVVHVTAQNEIRVTATNPRSMPRDRTIGGQFRASVLLLGPLLARLGRARVYQPGGDNIDSRGRGVDFHVTNLRRLGASVSEGSVGQFKFIEARGVLKGPGRYPIHLPKVSVGATQNTIMAACVAQGITVIENASIEPETLDLVKFLKNVGADIKVDKNDRLITIKGKDRQQYLTSPRSPIYPILHTVIPDRIVAATYAISAVITAGRLDLVMQNVSDDVILELLESEFWRLLAAGVDITLVRRGVIRVERKRSGCGVQQISPVSVKTKPYPGFPTDLHPQWAALMCFSTGHCWIEETIFDQRFGYIAQLQRLGARIHRDEFNPKKVNIRGYQLQDYRSDGVVEVEAGDIRAGAALILAAVARKGRTRISGLHHVYRGYENIVDVLRSCGASVRLF